MAEHTLYELSQDWLKAAVEALRAADVEVVAPVETEPGVVDLALVTADDAIALNGSTTRVPLKRVFLPITEVLLEYERPSSDNVSVHPGDAPAEKSLVVLGVRPCDAAAMTAMDQVFQWDYDDVRYRERREKTTLVAVACDAPAEECFCTSLGGSPHGTEGVDAIVYAGGDTPLVEALTDKGRAFVERLGDAARQAPADAQPPEAPAIEPRFDPEAVKHWLDENFESPFWTEQALSCLGCGACSFLCPTCHCFDIVDESTWNRGERRRNWDFCAEGQFTRHASGHNPRPTQASRYRQRIMHKFKYFPERFERLGCVGCGRCVRVCGTGRNLAEALAEMTASSDAAQTQKGG